MEMETVLQDMGIRYSRPNDMGTFIKHSENIVSN